MVKKALLLHTHKHSMTYLEKQKIWTRPGLTFSIQGYSRAKRCTGFWIPEWGLLLDAGIRSESIEPKAILLTHTHTDHSSELAHLCMNTRTSFPILCPSQAVLPIQHYFSAVSKLRGCSDRIQYCDALFSGKLSSISPVTGPILLGNLTIYAHSLHHSIPSQGYIVYESNVARLAYFCDGTTQSITVALVKAMADHIWSDVPVVMLECTYMTETAKSIATRHGCFENYKPLFIAYPHVQFLMFHFNSAYTDDILCEYSLLYPNVHLLI